MQNPLPVSLSTFGAAVRTSAPRVPDGSTLYGRFLPVGRYLFRALMRLHSVIELAIATSALGCALTAAFTDLRIRRIPNWLTGPAMLLGLSLHAAAQGWKGLGSSLGALLLCGAVFLVFNLAGGMGAGDVKLIAAEACLLGLPNAGSLLACTAICGGVLALALAARRGRLWNTLQNVVALTFHHSRHGLMPHPELNVLNSSTLRLPYALAIGAGTVITLYLQPAFRIVR